jgi:hypothetical protein
MHTTPAMVTLLSAASMVSFQVFTLLWHEDRAGQLHACVLARHWCKAAVLGTVTAGATRIHLAISCNCYFGGLHQCGR